ncbi:MAG: alpha/beta hydrolase [Candidatus Binatia bacterium]|nr:alpha/beta hydrolase [Candidatus Binatia bacterium]
MASLSFIEAENERYAATLVFLHGLWAGPEIWRALALGFAHRGWRCAVVDARETAPQRPSFGEWCDDVAEQISGLELPAITIGHDAGGLVGLNLATRGAVMASVAVAPLLAGPKALLDPVTRVRARLGLGAVEPPAVQHAYRNAGTPEVREILTRALTLEPAARIGSLRGAAIQPGAAAVPSLLVAQAQDAIVPSALVEITAAGIEADALALPGSHWPMLEPNPDAWISPIHRWLVRKIGPSLLLLRGDEDLVDE